jgi:TRAP-type C4-dicarboxylate transport system permease small subunit
VLQTIIKIIGRINIVFILALTLITLVDVIARYLFNTSFMDTLTLSSYLLAMINALALPGITLKKGHVQVDMIYQKLPRRLQHFCDIVNNLLAAVLFLLMSGYAFGKAWESFERGFFQGWMKLPEFPPKLVFACGCLMTAITFFTLLLENLGRTRQRQEQ